MKKTLLKKKSGDRGQNPLRYHPASLELLNDFMMSFYIERRRTEERQTCSASVPGDPGLLLKPRVPQQIYAHMSDSAFLQAQYIRKCSVIGVSMYVHQSMRTWTCFLIIFHLPFLPTPGLLRLNKIRKSK